MDENLEAEILENIPRRLSDMCVEAIVLIILSLVFG